MRSTAQKINNTLMQDNNLRINLIGKVSIYAKGHITDPIHNLETLKLFNKIDNAYINVEKDLIYGFLKDFITNDNGKYNSDYGKAKDHLESLISYNNKLNKEFKLTTYEVIYSLGITKTARTDTVTKFFEFLTAEVIKGKYNYVKDVIIYAPGKIKVPYFNGTKQSNFDLLVEIEDFDGKKIYLAFDHKVKDIESCIKDVKNHGLKYSVFTLGDVEDQIFYESPAVKEQLFKHDSTESYNINIANKIIKSEISSFITDKNISDSSKVTTKILDKIDEYETKKDINIMLKTPLIPAMLCSSRDLAKVLADLSARSRVSGIDLSDSGFN